jgi:VWFA-related protein
MEPVKLLAAFALVGLLGGAVAADPPGESTRHLIDGHSDRQDPHAPALRTPGVRMPVSVAGRLDRQAPIRSPQVFRSHVDVIAVTATVLDRDGRLVADLPREAFDVYEDGQLQSVTQFTQQRVPISVGVLLDVSDSMFGRRIEDARTAVSTFLRDMLDPADEFAIIAFNHAPRLLAPWTADHAKLDALLARLKPSGGTAAYDAVLAMLPLFETRHRQRAAVLLISDGADTASDARLSDVRSALLRSDAFAYAVAIDSADRQAINTGVNPTALREITDQSGGRTEVAHSSAEIETALSKIAAEINSQYLLGYASTRAADGQYHSIRVRVRGTDYRVRARTGYVAVPKPPS